MVGAVAFLAAAAGWLGPATLSPAGGLAVQPDVAVDGHGNATAVWIQGGNPYLVMSATRRAGSATWSAPVRLSEADRSALDPHVAVNARGAAVAVWSVDTPGFAGVEAAVRRSRGGAWGSPARLSQPGRLAGQPEAGIDRHGRALVVWVAYRGDSSSIESAERKVGRRVRPWSRPVTLERAELEEAPDVAVNRRGDAVAVWERHLRGGPSSRSVVSRVVVAGKRGGRRTWRAPVALGEESDPGGTSITPVGPHVVLADSGDATVVWQGDHGVAAARRAAGGHRWRTDDVSQGPGGAPQVATDPSGDAVVMWSDADGVQSSTWSATGCGWSEPAHVADDALGPQVALDRSGGAVATWDAATYNGQVFAARATASGTWASPVALGTGALPQIAGNPRGDAAVVWQWPQEQPRGTVVQASVADAAHPPPRTRRIALSVRPRKARAGRRTRFHVRVRVHSATPVTCVPPIRVSLAGRHVRVDRHGRATLTVRPRHHRRTIHARATWPGFKSDRAAVRVRS